MKKNAFIYLATCGLCLLFLTACPVKVPELAKWEVKTRSYVLAFGTPAAFQMQLTDNNNIVLYWSNISQWFTFQSTGSERARFDRLVVQHNDIGYIRMTVAIEGGERNPTRRAYILNNIVSIDVISDTDFNTEYPAGTSLACFVRLLSVSPMHFIESGYQETFDWYRNYPVDFLREAATFPSLARFCKPCANLKTHRLQVLVAQLSKLPFSPKGLIFITVGKQSVACGRAHHPTFA